MPLFIHVYGKSRLPINLLLRDSLTRWILFLKVSQFSQYFVCVRASVFLNFLKQFLLDLQSKHKLFNCFYKITYGTNSENAYWNTVQK